ncbi:MAG TPA: asparagine synthase (glutamine-hydrolyzing) [Balneola sp.]|jgi:asparagine synthase (glutamine-hydrolysing)|nr:asparagine synthase (glutamine-hydrolyzing) [Balneola sp.]MAO77141.1 asparagine synthase (glutamine-hydrolyzing) [Balneola sp.]MBF63410.1 asparagine synthase (glutamine-hydrolyzing) [Balneola sp.]HAH50522.1 asparagine synthase (glutamine-hydrolyzing) [Balneola sp.]HBZ37286.1 asparagine synthase (glutamine-hydrolyzing) [Balneola sp.]|tara:strand:+ start:20442 stop:22280 length:1839 start_codon:yes stop_codon:yes gene_type:complete
MCGIAGYIPLKKNEVDASRLKEMTNVISHRGPDDEGFFIDELVGLGHRRLSIIDLSKDGHQPMSNDDGLIITYNGEVYNYIELREELEKEGEIFKTKTDTEVILAAYKKWGRDCVKKFNGMWAFAIYDSKNKILFCSRDHYGIKPFYYTRKENVFLFGSEIRQLLFSFEKPIMNEEVVRNFLFASVNESVDKTFFKNIVKLPGGHNLTINLKTGKIEIEEYYSLERDLALSTLPMEESIEKFGEDFLKSIKIRLRSDVVVGSCLSGGLDSSSVASIASNIYKTDSGRNFSAITAVSEEVKNDESGFAKIVAENGEMNWITVKPDYTTFKEHLPEIVKAQEEPFGSCSIVMQFLVMKSAKENGITVLLDGQGGDETLLGYERYYVGYLIGMFKKHGFFRGISELKNSNKNNALFTPLTLLKYLIHFSSARFRYIIYRKRHSYLKRMPEYPMGMRFSDGAIWDIFEMQKKELMDYNLPKLLRFEDKNSMWYSIEARLPFLDPDLVKTSLSIPEESKINEGWTKFVLRKFVNNILPKEITWRKNKFGFEAPEDTWIKKHSNEMIKSIEDSDILRYLCKMDEIEKSYDSLENETKWKLYSVALWEKEFNVQPGEGY